MHIELLPDWKDPLCPGKQRVALLMADESIPYARRKRFSRMIKTKKKLTGEIVFDHNIGWKHILSLDDEVSTTFFLRFWAFCFALSRSTAASHWLMLPAVYSRLWRA